RNLEPRSGLRPDNHSMVTVPAWVWRGGRAARGVTVGAAAGLFFGGLAFLDSGMWLSGVLVFVILSLAWGIVMDRRSARYWPGARDLTGEQRVSVVRAARRGERVAYPRLAPAVIAYRDGMHAAAAAARPLRWLIWFVLAVAAGMAIWDTVMGSTRDAVASCVYLGLLVIEVTWWPTHLEQLLANVDRAAKSADQSQTSD
ncbi:MAG TPA: hypothetical protein VF477_14300, partial [Mycobacterium sp.]